MKSPSLFRLFAILCTGALLAFGAPARADSHDHHHDGGDHHDHHDFHGHDDHSHFFGGHGHFWPHIGFGFGYPGYYGSPYYGGYYGSYYDPYYYGDYYPRGRIYRGAVVGDSGDIVVDVQRALRHRGYSPGPIDGIVGIGTRAAIRVYQADHRLPVTGRIDGNLVHALGLG